MVHTQESQTRKVIWAIAGLTFLGLEWYILAIYPLSAWAYLAYLHGKQST